MIVTDSDGENAYVVIDLDQYELFIDAPFSKGKEIDSGVETDIYPDIDPENEPNDVVGHDLEEEGIPDIWDVMKSAGGEGPTWNPEQLSDEELVDLEKQYEAFAKRNVQDAIEETIPKTAESDSKKDEDEFGEEQFYLEPID